MAPIKVEPQVAVVCDVRNPLHPQYMDSAGKWVSDMDNKNSCLKDKIEILDFCRKVKRTNLFFRDDNPSSFIVSSDRFSVFLNRNNRKKKPTSVQLNR